MWSVTARVAAVVFPPQVPHDSGQYSPIVASAVLGLACTRVAIWSIASTEAASWLGAAI